MHFAKGGTIALLSEFADREIKATIVIPKVIFFDSAQLELSLELEASSPSTQCSITEGLMHFAKGGTIARQRRSV